LPIREERNVNDVISMTDNEATMTTFVRTRTRPDAIYIYEAEAEVKTENFGLASRT